MMATFLSPSTPSSSITYATLRTAVADWLHRSDADDFVTDGVRLAEADIRNDVRVQAMEQIAAGTVASGQIAHPERYIEMRRLVVDDIPYTYVTPERFARYQRTGSIGYVYTSIGQTIRVLTGTNYSLVYWQAFADLIEDTDTNWLLKNAFDVYLFGALKHASLWSASDNEAIKYAELYKGAVARVNAREQSSRYSGPLQMIPVITE